MVDKRRIDNTPRGAVPQKPSGIAASERARQDKLDLLKREAEARARLEERIRKLVTANPQDAVNVLRNWLRQTK